MSKKINLGQIEKLIELVGSQNYSFKDAGKAVGLSRQTASKHYQAYEKPKGELVVHRPKPKVNLEDEQKAEEKRKLLASLDREPTLLAAKKLKINWNVIGLTILIGAALIALMIYFKKEKPALTKEQVNITAKEEVTKSKPERKTVMFKDFRS